MLNDNTLQEKSDVIPIECREVERAIVGMQGQYKLESWHDASGGHRTFSCHVLRMSSGAIEITGPVTGSVGERVTVHLERFGRFEGPVIRIGERRLVMRIVATNDDRNKIARKIEWVKNEKNRDKRRHERLIPRDPHSTLYLRDGHAIPCQIIDYSVSGAAVSADTIPELGTMLIVGKIIGQVVRQFPEGFAIEFIIIQDLRTVDELFTKLEDKS